MYGVVGSTVITHFLRRVVGGDASFRSVCNGIQVRDWRKRWFCVKRADTNNEKGFDQIVTNILYSSYLKYYFPSPRSSFDIREKDETNETLSKINVTYPLGMKEGLRIVKGKQLEQDVLTLLSNGGKRDYLVRNNGDKVAVDSLAGKYLLICCFKVPFWRKSLEAYACRSMISAYSQLVNNNENFEMVIVAKIAPLMAAEEEEGAFNHFFEAFPCIAIPFWDTESCDYLCKSFGLTIPDKHFAALVLDPDQMVLQTEERKFYSFGAHGFPYSDERLNALCREDTEILCRLDHCRWHYCGSEPVICKPGPVSLVELLGGNDLLLSRFGCGDKICVSELSKKKCVVFYLCLNGVYMYKMEWAHQRCVAKNLEFEVVVVHIPFYSDTTSYFKAVQAALERHESSSWWVMPVNDDGEAAARRLWGLCGLGGSLPLEEQWIFVADGGSSGEFYGKELMDRLSPVEMYPYTRKSMLDEILCRIRSITLESLLGYDNQLLSSYSTTRVNVSELKGKNVVLYLDYYDAIIKGGSDHYKWVLCLYEQMQKDCPNSEVVFVPVDEEISEHTMYPPMPWLVLPHPAAVLQGSIIKRLFPDNEKGLGIFAFGDDGHVRSVYVCGKLDGDNVCDLFSDTLFQEVFDGILLEAPGTRTGFKKVIITAGSIYETGAKKAIITAPANGASIPSYV